MPFVNVFVQGLDPVYKNLVILLTLFIILAFGLYVSFILYEQKNYPVSLTENSFDLFLNQNKLGKVTGSTIINNVTVKEFSTLGDYDTIDFCPRNQCSVNLTTGVKVCPSTVSNQMGNNNQQVGITYNTSAEVCVEPNKCPAQLPYAIHRNGEALSSVCEPGDFCYCTSNPQCATRVLKYFQNEFLSKNNTFNEVGFNFATTGDKPDNNIHNNIVIEEDTGAYCKINPAFTNKIINGCDMANTLNDPINCQNTNIYTDAIQVNKGDYTVAPFSGTLYFSNLIKGGVSTNNSGFPKGSNFLVIKRSNQIDITDFNPDGAITINDIIYYYTDAVVKNNLALLRNIKRNITSILIPGLENNTTAGTSVTLNQTVTNCQLSDNDEVNYKNMLTCVQPFNQPCSEGVLAYNVDNENPRNFCQGSGANLIVEEEGITDFYLTAPAYYTLSCVTGSGCDESIDTTLCTEADDCTNAFAEKRSKLFPKQDYSALTNQFFTQPKNFGISYQPYVTAKANDITFTIVNNFMPLELGDYWMIENSSIGVFLTQNSKKGSNILNVNNSTGLSVGMNINLSNDYNITSIDGTSVYLNSNLNYFDSTIATTGYELIAYGNNNRFGFVKPLENLYNGQTFNLYDLGGTTLTNNFDVDNTQLIFFKQFGFNGLNYNTTFVPGNNSRQFNKDYMYKFNFFNPPITIEDIFQSKDKNSYLFSPNANFRQKYSMYYPVFNEAYFRQECVYCSPSLQAFTNINDSGVLTGVNIQFCGKEFSHYAYGNINSNWGYNQVSFALTAINNISNCSCLVLNEAIPGLQPGDYIIDEKGFFDKTMFINKGSQITGPFIIKDVSSNQWVADDIYNPYKLNNRVFSPPNNFTFNPNSVNGVQNLFFGKAYYHQDGNQCFISPSIQVVKISSDGKTIYTDSPSVQNIPPKTVLQFISSSNNLELSVIEDIESVNQGVQTKATIEVGSITQGRITSLNITNGGQGYTNLKRPNILISKYSPDVSVLKIE